MSQCNKDDIRNGNTFEKNGIKDNLSHEIEPEYVKTLKFHSDTISQLVFNPNNKELISASYDHSILIWSMNLPNASSISKSKPKKLLGHKSLVNDVVISQTGLMIASASSDCTVRVWSNSNDDNEKISSQIYKHNSLPVKSVDISCDSKLLVTGSDDKSVKIINISDKKVVTNLLGHSNWIKCVRFSKDSRLIVSASDDKSVKLWDVNRQILNSTISNIHNGVINVVRFHPDNSSIATGCFDRKIRIFDTRSKQLVQIYENHTKPVTNLDFHPDGFYMASTSFDETVKIYDIRYGDVLYTLTGHEAATSAVAFSKFGDILATGGADSVVNIWSTNLEEEKQNFYEFARNDFPVELDLNSVPQSSGTCEFRSEKSSPKEFNSETCLNYKNKNYMSEKQGKTDNMVDKQNSLNSTIYYENISEELSKVFERMVYQLELITTTFKNFESRISKVEECVDEIIREENKKDFIDQEELENELINKLAIKNYR